MISFLPSAMASSDLEVCQTCGWQAEVTNRCPAGLWLCFMGQSWDIYIYTQVIVRQKSQKVLFAQAARSHKFR